MEKISKYNLALLLIGLGSKLNIANGLGGMTRLQKYLFLLEKESGLILTEAGYNFIPYKAGPYASELYDDLELLENLGMIRSEITAEATDEESTEIGEYSFEDLMGDQSVESNGEYYDGFGSSDAYEERRFTLTQTGRQKVEELIQSKKYEPIINAIRKLKSKFKSYSLQDILYYVYTKYPEMTIESEIKNKVLSKKRRL